MAQTPLRVLRVFFDFGHEWPLWEAGDQYTMAPSDYGFSPELVALLRRWHAAWEPIAAFDANDVGPAPTAAQRAEERDLARQAVAVIRREVPPDVAVRAG